MLIVPFCMEVTFSGTYAGRNWANIIHVFWNKSTLGRDGTDLSTMLLGFEAAWSGDLATAMNENVVLTNVKLQDLDSASGLTLNLPSSETGGRASSGMPGNVSVLATKDDSHTRNQRPGRWFQVGVCEVDTDSTNPSQLDSTGVSTWQGAFTDFFGSMSGTQAAEDFYPVVLHKNFAGDGFIPYAMNSMTISSRLATQRRRLR